MTQGRRESGKSAEARNHLFSYTDHAPTIRFRRMPVKVGNVGRLRASKRMSLTRTIRTLRERAGLSMEEAARAGGWRGASSYQRYENDEDFTKKYLPVEIAEKLVRAFAGRGNPSITPEEIMALTAPQVLAFDTGGNATVRMVRIVGIVEAGVWREAIELPIEEQQVFPMPAMVGYEHMQVFGLQVRGPSMNKVYPEGSIAFFIKVPDLEPVQGNIVVVAAVRNGMYETTLKELGRDKKGKTVLVPRSTDPRHQLPIYPDELQADAINIIGVAIGKFELIPQPKRRERRN